jgi:hypothetical protein
MSAAASKEEEGLHGLIKRCTARTEPDKKTTLSRAQKSAGCRPKSDTHPFKGSHTHTKYAPNEKHTYVEKQLPPQVSENCKIAQVIL